MTTTEKKEDDTEWKEIINRPKRHHQTIDDNSSVLSAIRTKFLKGDTLQKSIMNDYLSAHKCYPGKRATIKTHRDLMQSVIDGSIGMPIGM